MNAPGQYLYENYCQVFGTLFAPKWEGLSEDSRSNWAKLELATRIDCTCNSDVLGRCVVHPSANAPDSQPSSTPQKSVDEQERFLRVYVRGLHSNEWASIGWISNLDLEVIDGILWTKGRKFGGCSSCSWMLCSVETGEMGRPDGQD